MSSAELLIGVAIVVVVISVVGFMVAGRRSAEPDTVATGPRPTSGLGRALRSLLGDSISDSTWDELEELLLGADVGLQATDSIVSAVRRQRPDSPPAALSAVRDAIRAEFGETSRSLDLTSNPAVVMVVGVNGSGKTTTIAKLARNLQLAGKTVTLGAADTFRAAAGEQLKTWGDRLDARVVGGSEGADPASVAFDTLSSARASGVDVVLIDTAGRLHGKKNLMEELSKIHRVLGGADEVLLVLDATSGQNGLVQVREFSSSVPVSGIILSKFDGTARGGIVVAVERELGVPVKFVGVGEGLDDLQPFDPDAFVSTLTQT